MTKEKEQTIERLKPRLLLRQTRGKVLGMELTETEEAFYLSSEGYIKDKIEEMGMPTSREYYVATPLPYKVDIYPEEEYQEGLLREYQKIVGSLIHAANSLRFDIAYSVGLLSRMVTKVDPKLISYGYRVLNYLYATRDYKLQFKKRKGDAKNRESTVKKSKSADVTPDKKDMAYGFDNDDISSQNVSVIEKIEKELKEIEKERKERNQNSSTKEQKEKISMSIDVDAKLTAYVDADIHKEHERSRKKSSISFRNDEELQ